MHGTNLGLELCCVEPYAEKLNHLVKLMWDWSYRSVSIKLAEERLMQMYAEVWEHKLPSPSWKTFPRYMVALK